MGALIRRRAVINGRVQGVGFRAYVAHTARDLNLAGFVANQGDGSVVCVAEGNSSDVEKLFATLGGGPPLSRVDSVDVTTEPPRGERRFSIR